jgi:hypothetical protein
MVWLPWPRVLSLDGMTTARPRGTRLISRSRMRIDSGEMLFLQLPRLRSAQWYQQDGTSVAIRIGGYPGDLSAFVDEGDSLNMQAGWRTHQSVQISDGLTGLPYECAAFTAAGSHIGYHLASGVDTDGSAVLAWRDYSKISHCTVLPEKRVVEWAG